MSVIKVYRNRNENLTVKVFSIAKKIQEYTFGTSKITVSKIIIADFFNKYFELTNTSAVIVINIPAFKLIYDKNGRKELDSNLLVGKNIPKKAVFSGQMSEIIFSLNWNVPSSFLRKEILPAIAKNANYLAHHNMELVGNKVRQRTIPQKSPDWLSSFSQIPFPFVCMIRLQKTCSRKNKGLLVTGAS